MVISSYVATAIVDPVFGVPAQHSSPEILVAIYGYAVQIYADFSGYTDIAIGIALLLGIAFPQNFDRPYSAVSLQDFWRRWHMTLSRWLRDYLYIPLGGSRHGTLATYRNLILTMALGGLWHGASLTFLVWGVFHGLGLALERLVVGLAAPCCAPPGVIRAPGEPAGLPGWAAGAGARWLGRLVTFNLVCVGWVLFRANSLSTAGELLTRSVTAWGPAPLVTGGLVAVIAGVLATQFLPASVGARVEAAFACLPLPVQGAALGRLLRRRGGLRPARRCPLHLLSVLTPSPSPDPTAPQHRSAPAVATITSAQAPQRVGATARLRPPPAPPGPSGRATRPAPPPPPRALFP